VKYICSSEGASRVVSQDHYREYIYYVQSIKYTIKQALSNELSMESSEESRMNRGRIKHGSEHDIKYESSGKSSEEPRMGSSMELSEGLSEWLMN
jgi:hypothetical protein